MNKHVIVCFLWLFISSCHPFTSPTESDNGSPGQNIHDKIKEDLADGISHPNTIVVDESNLPSIKLIAERGHSSISFKNKHWEIVDLIGYFDDFEAVMFYEKDDFSDAVFFAKANPLSIVMPNFKMMSGVQNEDYLNSKKHPMIEFQSTSFQLLRANEYNLKGFFDMKGVQKELSMKVTFNGYAYPEEKRYPGFSVEGAFHRMDFGIGPGMTDTLHSGRKMHSDTIYFMGSFRMEKLPY